MLTSEQIRGARAAIGWSAQQLAVRAEVAEKTVLRIEAQNGVPNSNSKTLNRIKQALEAAGIEFIGSPDHAPGIRIHTTQ